MTYPSYFLEYYPTSPSSVIDLFLPTILRHSLVILFMTYVQATDAQIDRLVTRISRFSAYRGTENNRLLSQPDTHTHTSSHHE